MATICKQKSHKNGTAFRQLRKLCAAVASHEEQAAKVREIQSQLAVSTENYPDDLDVWLRCLICDDVSYPPPMDDDQLIELFAELLDVSKNKLKRQLDAAGGSDIADVIVPHFEASTECPPASKSLVTIQEVDSALRSLTGKKDLAARVEIVRNVARWCTSNDLKMFINLLRHDLMIDADAKLILGALDEKAYDVYAIQRDISQVVKHLTAGLNHPRQLKLWEDITEITKLLPDVFSGTRICLDDSVVKKNELKRLIIAYNGQVVQEDVGVADFFVTNQPKPGNKQQGRAVRETWLLDCIKTQTKLDHQPYVI